MTQHLNTRDGDDVGPERPRSSDRERPFSDREVPIEGTRMSEVTQAWLDGDLSDDAVVEAGAATRSQVDLWRRIGDDLAPMRSACAPADMVARVMGAI
jgi:hypothetical protein